MAAVFADLERVARAVEPYARYGRGGRLEWPGQYRNLGGRVDACLQVLAAGLTGFADRGGFGARLAESLAPSGRRIVLVTPGDSYRSIDGVHYEISPTCGEDYDRLFREAAPSSLATGDRSPLGARPRPG